MAERSTSQPFKARAREPPAFKGGRDPRVVLGWVSSMNNYCRLCDVPAERAVLYAGQFLENEAQLWFESYFDNATYEAERHGQDYLHWDNFTRAFKANFLPENYMDNLVADWTKLRQTTSVHHYNIAFQDRMRQLPLEYTTPQPTLHKYILGLKPMVQLQVKLTKPSDLQAAMAFADEIDTTLYSAGMNRNNLTRTDTPKDNGGYQPMEIDAAPLTKLSEDERRRALRDGLCFRCRRPGHMAVDCKGQNQPHGNSKNALRQ